MWFFVFSFPPQVKILLFRLSIELRLIHLNTVGIGNIEIATELLARETNVKHTF